MSDRTKEFISQLNADSPAKIFFDSAQDGMSERMKKQFIRCWAVVEDQGAIYFGDIWKIGYNKM